MNNLFFLCIDSALSILLALTGKEMWDYWSFSSKQLNQIPYSNIENFHLIEMVKDLLSSSEGFIFLNNQLIFSTYNNNLLTYNNWNDIKNYCNNNNIKWDIIVDNHGIKVVNLYTNINNCPENNKTIIHQTFNKEQLILYLDNNYNIVSWENPKEILQNPETKDTLQNWCHQLIDKSIFNNNSYNEIIKCIEEKNHCILTTLNDESYNVELVEDSNYIILKFHEITDQINTKSDLYNNYQLIQYLMQSLKDPIIVFNKWQNIEFSNNQAKELLGLEILDNYNSVESLSKLLNNNFTIIDKNCWKINNNIYQLNIKIIGNFICWILNIVEDLQLNTIINNIESSLLNDMEILNNINTNQYNPIKNQSLKKFTNAITNNLEKLSNYINKKQNNKYFLFDNITTNLTNEFINEKKIILVNKNKEKIYLWANEIIIGKIIHWIIKDIINLTSSIIIDFQTINNTCYIGIKLFNVPSYWNDYYEEIINNIKYTYSLLISENNGHFNFSMDNLQPYIKIIFHGYHNIDEDFNKNSIKITDKKQIVNKNV